MKARIERDWSSFGVRIWFWDSRPDGAHLHRMVGASEWQTMVVPPDALLGEPSLILTEDHLEALIREVTNVLPVSDATTAHLKDATEVRDRLLTLVEKQWKKS